MRRSFIQFLILIFFIFLFHSCLTSHQSENIGSSTNTLNIKFPAAQGYVNDFANILSDEEELYLDNKLKDFDHMTTNQICVVTLNFKEVTDSNFDEYALELSKYWGVGQKGSDNGLSIVISPNLRRIRICTGLGTEKIITDSICQQILDNKIMPQLRNGKYFEGINQATNEFIRVWNNLPSHEHK